MIDVYSEISISRLIYLNKKSLSPFKIKKDICEGFATYILRPEAELLAVIAHAALKENQYTLSEYVTILNYLSTMDKSSIEMFIQLTKKNHLSNATRWSLTITLQLHELAWNKMPSKIVAVLNAIGGQLSIPFFPDPPPTMLILCRYLKLSWKKCVNHFLDEAL